MSTSITRRSFIGAASASVFGLMLTACGGSGQSTDDAAATATASATGW